MLLHAAEHHGVQARRRHAVAAPGRAGREARRRGRAGRQDRGPVPGLPRRRRRARTTPSARSACSSTSGSAQLAVYFERCFELLPAGGRLLNHAISRPARRDGLDRRPAGPGSPAAASSTATCSPTASCTRSARSSPRSSSRASRRATWRACASTTRSRCAGGSPTSRRTGTPAWPRRAAARARIWRLYMAASALNFEANRTQVHQVLAVKPDGGRSGLPLRPTLRVADYFARRRRSAGLGRAAVEPRCDLAQAAPLRRERAEVSRSKCGPAPADESSRDVHARAVECVAERRRCAGSTGRVVVAVEQQRRATADAASATESASGRSTPGRADRRCRRHRRSTASGSARCRRRSRRTR